MPTRYYCGIGFEIVWVRLKDCTWLTPSSGNDLQIRTTHMEKEGKLTARNEFFLRRYGPAFECRVRGPFMNQASAAGLLAMIKKRIWARICEMRDRHQNNEKGNG